MAFTQGAGARVIIGVDGADAARGDIQSVGDALRQMDANNLRNMRGELTATQSKLDSLKAAAGVAAVTIASGFALMAAMVNEAIGTMGDIDDMAQKTGTAVETLSRLQKVAMMTGADFGKVDAALSKLAKGMGGMDEDSNKVLGALKRLGVSATDAAGKLREPGEVFIEAAEKLQDYTDDARKTALMNDALGKSGADLLPFMNDVSEHIGKFSSISAESAARAAAFQDNIGEMGVRVKELGFALAEAMLPSLIKMATQLRDFVSSGQFKEWVATAAAAVGKFAEFTERAAAVLIPAAKIAAGYFAVFVAAPAVLTVVSSMLGGLYGVAGRLVTGFIAGGGALAGFNTMLFGTSVQAQLASGALTKMKLAGSLMFAAFAGWQIGTYLRDNFVEARVAGLWFVESVLTGWETVKFNGQLAWNMLSAGWDSAIGGMQESFAKYLSSVAGGLKSIGAQGAAAEVNSYAEAVGAAATKNKASADGKIADSVALRAAHLAELDSIRKNIGGLVEYELSADNAATADKEAAATKKTLSGVAADNAAAIEKEKTAYAGLISSIRTKTEEMRLELAVGADATDSQKMSIKLDQELASGKLVLTAAHQAQARAALAEMAVTEQLLKSRNTEKDVFTWIVNSTQARLDSVDALAMEYAMYGQSADAHELAKVALTAEGEMQKFLNAQRAAGKGLTDEQESQLRTEMQLRAGVTQATMAQSKALSYAAQLMAENERFAAESISDPQARGAALLEIDAEVWRERIRLAGEGTEAQKLLQKEFNTWYVNQQKQVVTGADVTRAKDILDIMTAIDDATRSAANEMEASFGRVGSAIGGLTTSLSSYGKVQAAIAAQLAVSLKDAGGDQTKVQRANAVAGIAAAQAQIKSYGDMASAAKGFFRENTTGYKVMQGAEKAFRAYEMAMAIENMLAKSGLLTAFTTMFVTAKTAEKVAETTAAATSVGLAGTQASAWGITAVVKSIASMPFPANLAAGAATLAAVVAVGAKMVGSLGNSGSGGQSAAEMQKAQGSGGVFGNNSAQSDSVLRSLVMLEKNSDSLIPINRGMLSALRVIESSMKGLTNLLVRAPGVTDGSNLGIQTGQLNKGQATDGISTVMTGITKGLLGPGLGDKVAGFINNLWGKTKQDIVDSGIQFGGSVAALQSGAGYSQYASVDTTKSSFFGLKKSISNSVQTQGLSDDLAKQFGLVFVGVEDALTSAAITLGVGADHVKNTLDALTIDVTKISLKGLTGEALTSALNAVISKTMDDMSAAVFPEMDSFRQVGEGYAETVVRLASNYATLDATLKSIGVTFGATGVSSLTARERLIGLAGGMDKLAEQTTGFADNFLSEAERLAPVRKYVAEELARLGYAGLKTRDDFKNAVLGLATSGALVTAAGAETYAGLMAVQEAFALVVPALEGAAGAAKTAAAILDERRALQDQYDALTMSATDLLAKQKAALDPSNRALFENVQALMAADKAREKARETAQKDRALEIQILELTGDKLGAVVAARKDELAGLSDSTIALIKNRNALQDQAAAAASAVTGANSAFSNLKSSVAATKDQINAEYEAKIDALKNSTSATVASAKAQGDAFKRQASAVQSVFDKLNSALAATAVQSSAWELAQRRAAQDLLARAAIFTQGGGTANIEGLDEALATIARPSSMLFSSFEEYALDQARTGNTIAALQSNAKKELDFGAMTVAGIEHETNVIETTSAAQIQLLSDQHKIDIQKLDDVVTEAQRQLDAVLGVKSAVLTLADAVRAFSTSLGAVQNTPAPLSVSGAYQQVLGRAPEQAGLDYWTGIFGELVDKDELAQFVQAAQPELLGTSSASLKAIGTGTMSGRSSSMSGSSSQASNAQLTSAVDRLGARLDNQGTVLTQLAISNSKLATDFGTVSENGNGLRVVVMNTVAVTS